MHLLTLFITIPLTAFAVSFALSNTADQVALSLWPFEEPFTLSLPFFGLGALAAGFLLGAFFVWILSRRTAFRYWRERRRSKRMERELYRLHQEQEAERDRRAETEAAAMRQEPLADL